MSQPVTVRRYHLVEDEHSLNLGTGFPEWKREEVEEEARRTGQLVAVTTSCGYGWDESRRYDPRDTDD